MVRTDRGERRSIPVAGRHRSAPAANLVIGPVDVLGIPIHPVSRAQLVDQIVAWGHGSRLRRVYNVNIHAMNLAAANRDFRECLTRADLVFCDGFGVKWAGLLLGHRLPSRLTPPDWIDELAARAGDAGQPVFALGDQPGVAERFQELLRTRHPGYRSAGAHHGFFAKEGPANDAVVDLVNRSGAVHLLVGFGMPLQERWLEANAARLGVRTVIPVGALFRWYTGLDQRAPRWMTEHGLEWLARLARSPRRHFHRYVIGNPRFLLRVLRHVVRG